MVKKSLKHNREELFTFCRMWHKLVIGDKFDPLLTESWLWKLFCSWFWWRFGCFSLFQVVATFFILKYTYHYHYSYQNQLWRLQLVVDRNSRNKIVGFAFTGVTYLRLKKNEECKGEKFYFGWFMEGGCLDALAVFVFVFSFTFVFIFCVCLDLQRWEKFYIGWYTQGAWLSCPSLYH